MYLVSRTETFAKLFFLLSFSGIIMYIVLAFHTIHTAFISTSKIERINEVLRRIEPQRSDKDLKYILLWTIPEYKYKLIDDGQKTFINSSCSHLNCYLTTNKDLLSGDVTNFDAIIFSIFTLKNWKHNMPKSRSPKQKYVFFSMVSANKNPVCNLMADNFFNWTWSYKLDSDIVTPFIEVRTKDGKVVAPKPEVDWFATEEIPENTVEITNDSSGADSIEIGNKSKALMWYVDKCGMNDRAVTFAKKLKRVFEQHSHVFDIFGCGFDKCPKEGCLKALENDYYFYLVQEDDISEDYVTTEVLKAYHHNAVPIVVGRPDYYSKFLPIHSYIDTAHESIERLSAIIHYTIKAPGAYKYYLDWKKHFTIHQSNTQKGYCDLCAMLNDKKVETSSVYEVFRKWWFTGSLQTRCFPKGVERYDDVLAYVNASRRKSKPILHPNYLKKQQLHARKHSNDSNSSAIKKSIAV